MKIAVHGSYYARNFGDTLLVKIVCEWIKESGNFEIVLPNVKNMIEEKEINERRIKEDEWEEIKAVIFTGGGYFGEPNKSILRKHHWYIRNYYRHLNWLKKISTNNILILGLGFGPLNNKYFLNKTLALFKKSNKVFFRDDESYNYAKQYGYLKDNLRIGIDLAFSIHNKKISSNNKENSKIGIHVPVTGETISNKYYKRLKFIFDYDNVELFYDKNPKKNIIKKNSIYDRLIREKGYKCIPYNGADELLHRLNSYKVIITSKLHVGIVATNLGIPVYSIPNHNKTKRFYNQIGYLSNCNPIYDFNEKKHDIICKDFPNIKKPEISQLYYEKINTIKLELNNFLESLQEN